MEVKGKKMLITGGAGFLGSFLTEELAARGAFITVLDRFSQGKSRLRNVQDLPNVDVVEGDVKNYERLVECVRGKDLIWHLAGNTDIPAGLRDTNLDIQDGLMATRNVLEAMRETNVRKLVFPSSGAIYGEKTSGLRKESDGPCLPISLYGAGKVACESFISAYCHLFDLQAWIFRYGNIISGRITHGAIRDFIGRLKKDPKHLQLLGDGTQTKSYLLAEECIDGMLYVIENSGAVEGREFCDVFNLGAPNETAIMDIAKIVIDEMGIKDCEITCKGGERGWKGDQAKIALDSSKIAAMGWTPRHSSEDAVRISVRRMIEQEALYD